MARHRSIDASEKLRLDALRIAVAAGLTASVTAMVHRWKSDFEQSVVATRRSEFLAIELKNNENEAIEAAAGRGSLLNLEHRNVKAKLEAGGIPPAMVEAAVRYRTAMTRLPADPFQCIMAPAS